MKLVTHQDIYNTLKSKEEQIVHILERNARRSSPHLSPTAETLRNQKIEAQNVVLNTLLKEIREIIASGFFEFSDYSNRQFYLVNLKDLYRLKKDSIFFYFGYEGTLCKLGVSMNHSFNNKHYNLYIPSIEKVLQENPIK
jgi:hypothetical protein